MRIWNKPDLSNPLLQRAYVFAMSAHAAVGQKRKYSGEPYIVHPVECVAILQTVMRERATLAMQIGMVKHDTVEDTRWFTDMNGNVIKDTASFVKKGHPLNLNEGITFDLVEASVASDIGGYVRDGRTPNAELAKDVRRILSGLTDVSMPWDGNRKVRKALDLAHTAEQEGDVKSCKLADLISNAPSIIEHDPGFAVKWMSEKEALLEVLKDGGDPDLYDIATEIMGDYLRGTNRRV